MPKILVLDNLSEEGVQVFRDADGFEVDVKPAQSPEELAAIISDYDGVVVRSGTKVTREAIAKADKLQVIGRAGVGTDNIDKQAATERGIVVMNTPGGNTISTCEHTFAVMLALCRNIAPAHLSMEEGKWDRKKYMGTELQGKTLGVVGMGRIGGEVAKRAKAFDMKVIAFDPIMTKLKAEALGVDLVELDELIERADFITIHAPKTEKTTNLIRAQHYDKMKPTCRIINCARGGIVNEEDLAEALKAKKIAGAALDVYTSEPFENNPFIGLDNIVMTPHLAASTDEAQMTVAVDVAKQIVDYLKTGAIVNAVNVPSLDAETRKKLQPMLSLAESLGKFQSAYMTGTPTAIEIEYTGDLGVNDTYPITAAVLTGFLTPLVDSVNVVSAPSLLESHGISSSEVRKPENADYGFQIGVKVTTDKETHQVYGTLYSGADPRIVKIDGTRVEAVPDGYMLVCANEDKPLVLGRICSVIGDAGVNIGNLFLGREKAGGRAHTILNVDSSIPDDVLEQIAQIPHVIEARLVKI